MGWWRLILLIITAFTLPVDSQLDSNGFANIDCGLPKNSSYVDTETNLTYVSDYQFIDTGHIANISADKITNRTSRKEWTLRYFPTGIRNCYTIRSLTAGNNYLLRAGFYYGNYDGKNTPASFDAHIGVQLWLTVQFFNSTVTAPETIITSTADYLDVCLIKTGKGIPYISWIQLRQLKKGMYSYVNSTQSLISLVRYNYGSNLSRKLRYPDDRYDRIWDDFGPFSISTNSTVAADFEFETPSLVMQTAMTSSGTQVPLNISLIRSSDKTYVILHFAEIQNTSENALREFSIYESSTNTLIEESVVPDWLSSQSVSFTVTGGNYYEISLVPTSNSKLPPLLNAVEFCSVVSFGNPTYQQDVAAINHIKEFYNITYKEWNGDPCLPSDYAWLGIKCSTSDPTNYTRITSLSLSGLTGELNDYFGNLSALVSLNLSFNDLSGSLPASLDRLTNLAILDIRGNYRLNTTLPTKLLRKYTDGKLSYSFSNSSSNPPSNSSSKNRGLTIAIAVVVPLLLIAVVVAGVLWIKRKKYYSSTWENIELEGFSKIESRRFCYDDLKKITNDFKNIIGTGGFGSVYLGALEDGIQVAVKIHSNSSTQGLKELLTEAESLTRVHHKNLVSLMGYCIDKTCLALVYEYMPEGNLYDKLKNDEKPLAWKQRLQIAYESAIGLEYLHKACNPPLIHRDVKSSNILLTATFKAKIADFGLSRTFNNSAISHISTRVVGTPGYLDPEYYLSNGQLTLKSDVFSFGVVLLEIVTGQPPITTDQGGNLIQWVRKKLAGGDIESIVDPRMHDEYDINSVWKVTNLACKCTELTSVERPTMTEVAAELKECLDLVISTEEMHYRNTDNQISNLSQDTVLLRSHIWEPRQHQTTV